MKISTVCGLVLSLIAVSVAAKHRGGQKVKGGQEVSSILDGASNLLDSGLRNGKLNKKKGKLGRIRRKGGRNLSAEETNNNLEGSSPRTIIQTHERRVIEKHNVDIKEGEKFGDNFKDELKETDFSSGMDTSGFNSNGLNQAEFDSGLSGLSAGFNSNNNNKFNSGIGSAGFKDDLSATGFDKERDWAKFGSKGFNLAPAGGRRRQGVRNIRPVSTKFGNSSRKPKNAKRRNINRARPKQRNNQRKSQRPKTSRRPARRADVESPPDTTEIITTTVEAAPTTVKTSPTTAKPIPTTTVKILKSSTTLATLSSTSAKDNSGGTVVSPKISKPRKRESSNLPLPNNVSPTSFAGGYLDKYIAANPELAKYIE